MELTATILLILAGAFISGKTQGERIMAFGFYTVANIFSIFIYLDKHLWWFLLMQIYFIGMNIRGIINNLNLKEKI